MIKYTRRIDNIVINVLIDNLLYSKEFKILDSLFRTYTLSEEKISADDKEYMYYLCEKNNQIKSKDEYCTLCDLKDDNWVFLLISDLELFYAKILECTVIHGSCVKLNNKNILVIGERWSGKTTLVRYLSIDKRGKYLEDDCIYIINDSYAGFCMPLPIRNERSLYQEKYFITQTTDMEGVVRSLYSPPEYTNCLNDIDIIVFPKYSANCTSKIQELTQSEAFNKIMNNVRSFSDMESLFVNLKRLVTNSKCYRIEYSSSEAAYDLLFG